MYRYLLVGSVGAGCNLGDTHSLAALIAPGGILLLNGPCGVGKKMSSFFSLAGNYWLTVLKDRLHLKFNLKSTWSLNVLM